MEDSVNRLSLMFGIIALFTTHATAEVELREKFEGWALYCEKSPTSMTVNSCSIVQSVKAISKEQYYVGVAFRYDEHKVVRMIVRIPIFEYRDDRVDLVIDKGQWGLAFINHCMEKTCEAEIQLSKEEISNLTSSRTLLVSYKITEKEGIQLPIAVTGLSNALEGMARLVGIK